MSASSMHRGHNQPAVRPDEQMSAGPGAKTATSRQKKEAKRELNRKRRTRERRLEREAGS